MTATARAQPDETAAEYAMRLKAATAAWAAFDTLIRASETDSNAEVTRLHNGHAGLIRTVTHLMRIMRSRGSGRRRRWRLGRKRSRNRR